MNHETDKRRREVTHEERHHQPDKNRVRSSFLITDENVPSVVVGALEETPGWKGS